jgi:hypothetical protein
MKPAPHHVGGRRSVPEILSPLKSTHTVTHTGIENGVSAISSRRRQARQDTDDVKMNDDWARGSANAGVQSALAGPSFPNVVSCVLAVIATSRE